MKLDIPLQLRYGGVVLLFLGPAVALMAGGALLKARQAQNWPKTDARVIRSEIEVSQKASGFRRTTTRWSDYFTAAIQYEYVIDGQSFMGSRICLDASLTSGFDRADAQKWVRKYPVGKTIRIHHSPDQPHLSVINPTSATLVLAIAFSFGVLAIPGGIVLRRVARQMQPADEDVGRGQVAAVPAVSVQKPLEPSRPTHWLITTVAVVMGLLFFMLGSMCLPISIKQYVLAMNTSGTEENRIAGHIIVVFMMGIFTVIGAFLIWYPLKRARPTVTIALETKGP